MLIDTSADPMMTYAQRTFAAVLRRHGLCVRPSDIAVAATRRDHCRLHLESGRDIAEGFFEGDSWMGHVVLIRLEQGERRSVIRSQDYFHGATTEGDPVHRDGPKYLS